MLETLGVNAISCGNGFTFIATGQNEIMVAGKLPFTIQDQSGNATMGGDQTDFITTFQSVAQFERRVQILQVDATRFASILVDPQEKGSPKELFLWGETPLGLFQEPTPLNQLFADCQESPDTQS